MYLTISQAAERLSVGCNTVRRAILSRELPALKIRGTYRIDAKVFEHYLESNQVGARQVSRVSSAKGKTRGKTVAPVGGIEFFDVAKLLAAWKAQGVQID